MSTADGRLAGVGVVVTRAEGGDGPLTAALHRRGATVLAWPTVRHEPAPEGGPLDAALGRLATFDWLVLTSPRAVEAVAGRMAVPLTGPAVAVVGEGTADAARAAGMPVDLVPVVQTAEGLVAALAEAGVGLETRVLFPASEIARPTLEAGLGALGAEVERVTAYRTVAAPLDRELCRRSLEAGSVDVITLTSPSALDGLRSALGPELFGVAMSRTVAAVIGPATAAAVRSGGAARIIEAAAPSYEVLAEAVAAWAETERAGGRL